MPDPNSNRDPFFQAALGRTGECLDGEALSAAASNSAALSQVHARHLEACSHCRTEVAMLREFESAEPETDELASVQRMEAELRNRASGIPHTNSHVAPDVPPFWNRLSAWTRHALSPPRWTLALAAATLVAALGTTVYLRRPAESQRLAGPMDTVWRSGRFAAISPLGDLTGSPSQFQWEAAPGASVYRVELREVDGTVIWSGQTSGTSSDIPARVRGQLKPGRAFRWQADALDSAGAKIASTDLQSFHILATSH